MSVPSVVISDEMGVLNATDVVFSLGPDGDLLAGWTVLLESQRIQGRFRLSPDRGATWSPIYPLPPLVDKDIADPIVAWRDAHGQPMLSWTEWTWATATHLSANVSEVARLGPDGAVSIAEPAFEGDASNLYEAPSAVTADDGTIVLGASHVTLSSNRGDVVVRTLGDPSAPATLSATGATDSASEARLCGSGPRVGVVFLEFNSGFATTRVTFRRSDDRGATWPDSNASMVSEIGEPIADLPGDCAMNESGTFVLYSVSDKPVVAAGISTLNHVVGLRIAHISHDGQVDFRTRVTSDGEGGQFSCPRLVQSPQGLIDVVYFGGTAPGDSNAALRVRSSMDGAHTFESPVTLRSGIKLADGIAGNDWLGVSVGAARDSSSLFVTFPDNSGGTSKVEFLRVP